jgi:hypothetical protein
MRERIRRVTRQKLAKPRRSAVHSFLVEDSRYRLDDFPAALAA